MRVKCRIDGYYNLWDKLVSRDAVITDIGCGYGQMTFMLGMLSPYRKLLGVDYDQEKIEMAKHSFLTKVCNVGFECADMRTFDIPKSDAILFNDSLHYVDSATQYLVLSKAVASLNPNGVIIVRDGDASQREKHDKIKQTEVWSTKILKFNKTSEQLSFVNSAWMCRFAEDNNLNIKIRSCDKNSSETLYILSPNCN
jgi:trans-aconitate methyltransferase